MTDPRPFIRVLVVDDSAVVQQLLRTVIDGEPDMVVVGTAESASSAVQLVERLRPDLVTMDVTMPGESGIVAAQQIMAANPTPIAVVTAAPVGPDSRVMFDALSAGAVDVIEKPARAMLDSQERSRAFLHQLRTVAGVRVVGIRGSRRHSSASEPAGRVLAPRASRTTASLVAIGASTGGPPCVRTILGALEPERVPPVVIAQHMGRDFLPGFVAWLDRAARLSVRTARDGELVRCGYAYVSPGDRHLSIDAAGTLGLSDAPAVNYHRPSIDVLFESIASNRPAGAVAVLLTGMGADGARGLLALRQAGASTIAQDEASSVVYGMPKAAAELGAAESILDPSTIARVLSNLATRPPAGPPRTPLPSAERQGDE